MSSPENAKEQVETLIEKIKKRFAKEVKLISEKTGYDGKIISGVLIVCCLLAFISLFGEFVTTVVGVTLPAYWSILAIEHKEYGDHKQWLTYWAIYGLFTFLDKFANFILRIFPFYFVLKIIFLIWCFMPNTMGATFIFEKFIEPYFKIVQPKIDKKIEKFITEGKLRGKRKIAEVKEEINNINEKVNPTGETPC